MPVKITTDLTETINYDIAEKIISELYKLIGFNNKKCDLFMHGIYMKRPGFSYVSLNLPMISCKVNDKKVGIVLHDFPDKKVIEALEKIDWVDDYEILITDNWPKAHEFMEATKD